MRIGDEVPPPVPSAPSTTGPNGPDHPVVAPLPGFGPDRLRPLLTAARSIADGLELEAILAAVLAAACELVGAQRGNVELESMAGVGRCSVQHGGVRPVTTGRASDGMHVPIHAYGNAVGTLSVETDRRSGFDDHDRETLTDLAVVATVAVTTAATRNEAAAARRWLQASADITAQLLSADGRDPLRLIAARIDEVADAELVSISLITPDRSTVIVQVVEGPFRDELLGRRLAVDDTFVARVAESRGPRRFDAAQDPSSTSELTANLDLGPLMFVPLTTGARTRGFLCIGRLRNRPSFTDSEVRLFGAFADQASLALELSDARADQQLVQELEGRAQIARTLYDDVVQALFAVGLGLEGVIGELDSNPVVADRLRAWADGLDRTISDIRNSVLRQRTTPGVLAESAVEHLRTLVCEYSPPMECTVTVDPAVDVVMSGSILGQIDDCLRDALDWMSRRIGAPGGDPDHRADSSADAEAATGGADVAVGLDVADGNLTLALVGAEALDPVAWSQMRGYVNARIRARDGDLTPAYAVHRGLRWIAPLT